ncbi:MAG: hypothetical protein DPW19_01240 [cyanobacterium CYA1]|nr:hypothetical protein [cyanobacterium CYA1]
MLIDASAPVPRAADLRARRTALRITLLRRTFLFFAMCVQPLLPDGAPVVWPTWHRMEVM